MMTSIPHCPVCSTELIANEKDSHWFCPACQQQAEEIALCPQCSQALQILKACGAIDYFCTHGHGLISKRQIVRQYRLIPPAS